MPTYILRVTTEAELPVSHPIFEDIHVHVITCEGGDSEVAQHYHIVLDMLPNTIAEPAFRKRIRKYFSGNKAYSLSKCKDFDAAMRYACKGTNTTPPRVVHFGLIGKTSQDYYVQYWAEHAATRRLARRTQSTILQQLIETTESTDTPNVICSKLMDLAVQQQKQINLRVFETYVITAYAHKCQPHIVLSSLQRNVHRALDNF